MKNFLCYCFTSLICCFTLKAQQLNIDSLKANLISYHQVKVDESSPYSEHAYSVLYMNDDSLVLYKIPYDETGKITSDGWGLSIYQYKHDFEGREIEVRYFDKDGKLYFTDWRPIIATEYDKRGNKRFVKYYGANEELLSVFESRYDRKSREIKKLIFDDSLQLERVTKTQYKEKGKVVIKSRYDASGNLLQQNSGVSKYYYRYQTLEHKILLERRFLDANGKPFDITDDSGRKYYKVLYTYGLKENWVKLSHFDSEGNSTGESWRFEPDNS